MKSYLQGKYFKYHKTVVVKVFIFNCSFYFDDFKDIFFNLKSDLHFSVNLK